MVMSYYMRWRVSPAMVPECSTWPLARMFVEMQISLITAVLQHQFDFDQLFIITGILNVEQYEPFEVHEAIVQGPVTFSR